MNTNHMIDGEALLMIQLENRSLDSLEGVQKFFDNLPFARNRLPI